jgi:DNA-binding MltR family transcriptional regulator
VFEEYDDIVEEARRRREAGQLSDGEFADIVERALRRAGFENPQLAREVLQLRQTLRRETDRGCALTSAAYLDEMLVVLLTSHFIDEPKIVNEFFSPAGPLSSFSAKIDFAYALGLIDQPTRSSLHVIRRIRYDFAHVSAGISFKDEVVSSRCMSLHQDSSLTARQKVTRRTLALVGTVYAAIQVVEHREAAAESEISAEAEHRVQKLAWAIEDETDSHFFDRVLHGEDDDAV